MVSFDGTTVTETTAFNSPGVAGFEHQDWPPKQVVLNSPPGFVASDTLTTVDQKSFTQTDLGSATEQLSLTSGIDFFEDVHVIPRSFDFGNVLSDQTGAIEVFSGFRDLEITWLTFTNGAGDGTELTGDPPLSAVVEPLEGIQMTLEVSASGEAKVDDTLDFSFDVGDISVPIVINRIVLFSVPPELPYTELVEFLTDVLVHKDGSQQRIRLRKNPRQIFEWDLVLLDGPERARIHNLLFDWQARVFGVPVWHDLTKLTASVSAGGTTLSVKDTDYGSFRVGGLVLLYTDQTTFDVLTVSALTSTSITLESGPANSYSPGTIVAPLRLGHASARIQGRRFPVNAAELSVRFRVLDNDADIASTAAFSTYNSKVLLDGQNVVSGTMQEEFERNIIRFDPLTNEPFQESPWDRTRRASRKAFFAIGRQARWEIRQLLHDLGGRQTSFYLPTFAKDLELAAALVAGTSTMTITNVGYASFVQNKQPQNEIRIHFTDGTMLERTITNSIEVDSDTEQLELDATWPTNRTVDEIKRIEYLEEVHFASDTIRFEHQLGARATRVSAPVEGVFE